MGRVSCSTTLQYQKLQPYDSPVRKREKRAAAAE